MKPNGSECQCCACGEIFSSLSGFDGHQRWSGKGDRAKLVCLEPSSLRFEPRNRRDGVRVWVLPRDGWEPSYEAAQ